MYKMGNVRLGQAHFFRFSDPIIPLVLLLDIACWIGPERKNLDLVRSAACSPEWKLVLTPILFLSYFHNGFGELNGNIFISKLR
jgi:hypothetical protein